MWRCVRPALMLVVVCTGAVRTASAQQYCYEIRPGETAARVAERLTGDARNRYAPWFNVVDAAWTPIPKDYHAVLDPRWLGCLDQAQLRTLLRRSPGGVAPRVIAAGRQPLVALTSSLDFTFLAVSAAILLALSIWRLTVGSYKRRRQRARAMRRFGAEFVREFARPLTQFRGAEPLPRARLRISPRQSQLEILLAPSAGRSYPNLSDHRMNLEYDVARVVHALGYDSFATGRPYAEGNWVVLPFQYTGPVKREGVR